MDYTGNFFIPLIMVHEFKNEWNIFIFLAVQVIFICVYITICTFRYVFKFLHLKTLKTITLVKTNF